MESTMSKTRAWKTELPQTVVFMHELGFPAVCCRARRLPVSCPSCPCRRKTKDAMSNDGLHASWKQCW